MIGLLLVIGLAVQQAPKPVAQVALVTGTVTAGRLDLSKLGFGDGGLGTPRSRPKNGRRGQALSPGGILIRAQMEGVKLDFPSGAELLVTPSCRIHLKSGEYIEPVGRWGVTLILADGAILKITQHGTTGKIKTVRLVVGQRQDSLWGRSQRIVEAGGRREFGGLTLVVLGDGRVLFKPVWLGPVLCLKRKLCPAALAAEYPDQSVTIIGEFLRSSLQELVNTIPRRQIEFPQAPEVAATLARLAPILFASGDRVPAPVVVGSMRFPLAGDFHLRVTVQNRTVFLGLQRASSEVPAVEWTVAAHTRLQLVRPGGGEGGKPRYYLKGLLLPSQGRDLLNFGQHYLDEERARSALTALGAVPIGVELRSSKR